MSQTEASNEINNRNHENQDIHPLKFVDRMISEVPLVKSTVTVVEDGYDRVKGMNKLSETTLTLAEKSFSLWAMTMKPILAIFRGPITYADDLACDGLEKLELAAPVIRRKPQDLLTDVKTYATAKLQSAKDYGVHRIEPLLKTADTTLNNAIDFANSWLPKADDKEPPTDANSLVRFKAFSNKLQYLIPNGALNSLTMMKLNFSESLLGKLTTNSIELGNRVVIFVGEVGARATTTCVVVTKYVHEKLPETVRQQIQHGATYVDHLYQELKKAETAKDVYIVATAEVHAGVDAARSWIITYVPLVNKILPTKSIKTE